MKALRIVVVGLVQGVGFRPFIHRIAVKHGVKGYVRNVGGSEVEIYVEGDDESIKRFLASLFEEKPPPAEIEELHIFEEEPRGYTDFRIERSSSCAIRRSMIPPDLAVCRWCLEEVLNPRDRRYRYAFNSCAWCGPRFSMMYRAPYDRENTAMSKYPLCPLCLAEYSDINNVRRYHAQGISCPADGPRLELLTADGDRVECKDPLSEAAKLIDEGFIVAIKGIGGFHIAALASDDDVVKKLRERKRRATKPFAVMALNIDVVSRLVYLEPPEVVEVLESPQRPIVLLPKREDSPVSKLVSPGMDVEGVFLPYTPLHYLLLAETKDRFLIMTSANICGEPMCTDLQCVMKKLRGVVDYVLNHDREIVHRVDDSVVRYTDGELVIIRRGRGYAPRWIRVGIEMERDVVALGADLHNVAAIGFENKVVLTQYIGDLDSPDAANDLVKELKFFIEAYGIDLRKSIVVVDKHPGYISRAIGLEIAKSFGSEVIEVQHHHAHLLATAADRGVDLSQRFVGIAIDGVGYGDDGNIWGGEIMVIESSRYRRYGRVEYTPIHGDRDAIYPARFAVKLLAKAFGVGDALAIAKRLGLDRYVPNGLRELELVLTAPSAVYTSSLGRVLDALSTVLGVCTVRSYEGEPAILLEAAARGGRELDVDADLLGYEDGYRVLNSSKLVKMVIDLIEEGKNVRDIAYTLQIRIGEALGEIAVEALKGLRNSLNVIVLGGGAAVNTYIVRGIKRIAKEHDLEVVLPRRVPPNDGGIALGQAIYAALKLRDRS